VCGEERTGYGFDEPVLPGDEDNRVAIERLFESRSLGLPKVLAMTGGKARARFRPWQSS